MIKLENAIKQKIQSNVPPPNAPSTIARKGHSNTLIDTGEMLESVTHMQAEEGGALTGEVGIFDEQNAKKALWNEYGTDRIPARPFMRPAIDENMDRIAQEMAEEIFDQIAKEFREA
ncbi:MAG: hypothetical protein A4E48_00291 [Methanosaeta sp. PtaU1.Bin060]|nr:MAG: hypothetical protein A4E48_00291 [Methanosaeta sp. PtaU1.Bin060]